MPQMVWGDATIHVTDGLPESSEQVIENVVELVGIELLRGVENT